MDVFWPGPLTLVLEKTGAIPDITTAGLSSVCLRMPNHSLALSLIRASGVPIAAPSANISGRPSPTTYEHVLDDMDGRIEAIIGEDISEIGIESTVLDLTVDPPVILRHG
jgi:L-threonylcarbamoyladenylate synthase